MQLDVPAVIKRTALGCKWPHLMEMNIHLFGIILWTVVLLIDKGLYVCFFGCNYMGIILEYL